MSALSKFESFMEQMVEGSVARLFRSPVQPAEIAKRLERAMETQQTISVRRVIVPNAYRVFLNPLDFKAFAPIRVEMEREMATYLEELAQERNFTMLEHPLVQLDEDADVPRRSIQVIAEMSSSAPVMGSDRTQVFQPTASMPQPSQPRARLLLVAGGGAHVIPLESTTLTIGRGLNNDIILEDTRVSRHHAELRYQGRRFWVSDSGSTNGTFVNDEAVDECALRDGDIISLGGLELTFKES